MTEQDIKTLIRGELEKILVEDYKNRIIHGQKYHTLSMDTLGTHCRVEDAPWAAMAYCKTGCSMNWEAVDDEVKSLLESANKPTDLPIEDYARVREEYVVGMTELLNSVSYRSRHGEHNYKTDYFSPKSEEKHQPTESSQESVSLSRVISEFINENTASGAWNKRTVSEQGKQLETLLVLIGDVDVSSIGFPTMRDYKAKLLRYPKRWKNNPKLRDKTIQELLASDEVETISVRRFNNILQTVSSLFNWAERNGYVGRNYASGLSVKENKLAHEERAAFTPDDLSRLFTAEKFINASQAGYFFVPLLGLYTGARLEELCQLTADDVYTEDGVYVLDINNKNGKSLKTLSSKRRIPLHPFLVEGLRIPSLVEVADRNKDKRLFPGLKAIQGQTGRYVSKNFSELKKAVGITDDDGKKVFHSLRHTFATALDHAGVKEKLISQLLGHTIEGETGGRYAKPYGSRQLYDEAILKLDYGIDFSPLLKSKFIIGS